MEPGYTATDLNGNMGTQTVEEGAEIIVRMAPIGPDGPTGQATSGPKARSPGKDAAPSGRRVSVGGRMSVPPVRSC